MSATPLNPKQKRFLVALLTYGEVKAAAQAAEVTRDSAHRWLKDPQFQAAVREAEKNAIQEVSRGLVRLSKKALTVFEDAMDPAVPIGMRLRAADMALGRLIQIRELADLEERLAVLEERIEQEGTRR